ncbi:hypothetical protein BgiBS90_028889 [Biomphalaria glabrata]|nr:hypothetical protein BgiBS90_028889 [Biomphalaria glabrata]
MEAILYIESLYSSEEKKEYKPPVMTALNNSEAFEVAGMDIKHLLMINYYILKLNEDLTEVLTYPFIYFKYSKTPIRRYAKPLYFNAQQKEFNDAMQHFLYGKSLIIQSENQNLRCPPEGSYSQEDYDDIVFTKFKLKKTIRVPNQYLVLHNNVNVVHIKAMFKCPIGIKIKGKSLVTTVIKCKNLTVSYYKNMDKHENSVCPIINSFTFNINNGHDTQLRTALIHFYIKTRHDIAPDTTSCVSLTHVRMSCGTASAGVINVNNFRWQLMNKEAGVYTKTNDFPALNYAKGGGLVHRESILLSTNKHKMELDGDDSDRNDSVPDPNCNTEMAIDDNSTEELIARAIDISQDIMKYSESHVTIQKMIYAVVACIGEMLSPHIAGLFKMMFLMYNGVLADIANTKPNTVDEPQVGDEPLVEVKPKKPKRKTTAKTPANNTPTANTDKGTTDKDDTANNGSNNTGDNEEKDDKEEDDDEEEEEEEEDDDDGPPASQRL